MKRFKNHISFAKLQRLVVVVAIVAVVSPDSTAGATADVLPPMCKTHPVTILSPGCVPSVTSEVRDPGVTLPDLRPNVRDVMALPLFTYDEATETWTEHPPHLWFDTHAQNLGSVPFDLMIEDLDVQATATTSQCVSWTATYVCRAREVVGGFAWHDEHKHFHYQDFAKYELRHLTVEGRPDYSDHGLIGRSEKVSFCLVDSEPVQLDPPPGLPTYPQNCTASRQGVSPGWADIYSNDLPGQQLPLAGVPDGRYALVITIDPPGRLYEADRSNNRIEATIEISGNHSVAAVTDRAWR